MSPRATLFILGILLIAMPFPVLGFPQTWKNIFYVMVGIGLALGALISYVRAHAPQSPEKMPDDQSNF